MNMAGLIARGFGQHRSIVFINGNTLQQAKYVLKTQLGVSEKFYKHSDLFPIHGSGQGAGNSPGIWCCISSVVFDCYDKKANGAVFYSPDRSIKCEIYMIGFVDDTSGSTNDFLAEKQMPPGHYVKLAQEDAQRWNNILHVTGAALNDTKCSYHFVTYDFTITGIPMAKGGTFDPVISICYNSTANSTELQQLSNYQTHETLGCKKAPGGSDITAASTLEQKNSVHAKTIINSPFDRNDTWTYYHAVYLPSMTYSLPSTNINEQSLIKMQQEIKAAVLPKYSYNRKTPSAVVYGGSEFGCIEMRSLVTEKGIFQLSHLLMALRTEGITHALSTIAISWMQLLAGTSSSVFHDVNTDLPQLYPMKWLPAIRSFLCEQNLYLELELDCIPKLQRINDAFIMDHVNSFTPVQIQIINACRLFKGVTLLSDITTLDGNVIRGDMKNNMKPTDKQKGLMPYQDLPNNSAWVLWRRALKAFCTNDSLTQPLGDWLVQGPSLHCWWNSCFDAQRQKVFLYKNGEYEIYSVIDNACLYDGVTTDEVSPNSTPCKLDMTTPSITISSASFSLPQPTFIQPGDFQTYIANLPLWECQLLQNVVLSEDIFSVVTHMNCEQSTTYATSDGSAPNFVGSFGWAAKTSNGILLATNSGPAPGYRSSSFRTEAYGLLSFILFFYHAFVYTKTKATERAKLFTDSESLIVRIHDMIGWSRYYSSATLSADWDVLQAIVRLLKTFELQPSISHVLGHQDNNKELHELSLEAQLNVAADSLAGSFLYLGASPSYTVMITGAVVLLHSSEGTIVSRYQRNLRKLSTRATTREYICKKNHWKDEYLLVDWDLHGLSIRKLYGMKNFLTKYIHNWLPVGNVVSRYAPQYVEKCPSCECLVETREHMLRCTARQPQRKKLFINVRRFINNYPTDPFIKILLQRLLKQMLCDEIIHIPNHESKYNALIHHQSRVGWQQLLLGRFVVEWQDIASDYINSLPSKQKGKGINGKTWVNGITVILYKFAQDVWQERNDDRHGRDKTAREQLLVERALLQTEEFYKLRNAVLP